MRPSLLSLSAIAIATMASTATAATSETLEKAGLTLLGTFVGASLAFSSQLLLQRRQERKTELLAAHRILFCLLQQSNTILLFQRDWVEPHLGSRAQFIEIPAATDFDLSKNLFDFTSFGFLLKSQASRQIMYDLYLAQESYVETIKLINERSRLHRELLQPKLSEAGIGNGKAVTDAELRETLGMLLHGTMVNTTDQMLSLLKATFEKLLAAKEAFRNYAVTHFKTNDFTDFDFPETYGLS